MSQPVDVNTERWPIAPDGYIPNSVILSWRKKGKCFPQTDILSHLHWEDLRTGLLWFTQDEENTSDVEEDEKDEEESYDVQWKISMQNLQITSDDELINEEPQREEVCYDTRETFIATSCHENKQPREHDEEWKLCEDVTPPLQHLERRTSSFITTAQPEPPVESRVVSADDVLSKQEPRIASYIPPTEPKTLTPCPPKPPSPPREPKALTPHPPEPPSSPREPKTLTPRPLKPPSPPTEPKTFTPRPPKPPSPPTEPKTFTPRPPKPPLPTPEDPQPDLGLPEFSPIGDKRFLLSSTKYNNIGTQTPVSLDRRVLELYKKYRVGIRNSSRLGKCSTITERPLASTRSTVQSTSAQNLKNLHKPLQGFCSPPAAREHPVESSDARRRAAIIHALRPGGAVDHHRVVQKIWMKDTVDPSSFHFHNVIPLNAQQTFFTLNPCGKTQYGRLQFDWMRGHDKDKLCGLDLRRRRLALSDLSRST
ncbi:proteoglycan 4-like [Anarrhichthys ocellatus]|uniref:proteoglycan 4-like n=1 Tax=Anarrhichthys ocellatus TaxID=433405 RepID=UPI0012ECC4B9|nr:proteoglycan 4-like [Anarrhichthys ocellatus]XP_031734898.1 proteoglycan 4-like [Anarrhichthys ocellatus]XP_031734899.1 proteoglycan 4-like [Anarrhichthys ocellatus]XP_031734901.1 proteoglycan 4-like [Anarrhichthys ocellatus]